MKYLKLIGTDYIFNFGKMYKMPLEEVLVTHKEYIEWVIRNEVAAFTPQAMVIVGEYFDAVTVASFEKLIKKARKDYINRESLCPLEAWPYDIYQWNYKFKDWEPITYTLTLNDSIKPALDSNTSCGHCRQSAIEYKHFRIGSTRPDEGKYYQKVWRCGHCRKEYFTQHNIKKDLI